jgi:PhnB protein
MRINPYLAYDGNCREAIEFYQKVLKGKITALIANADTPMKDQFPPDQQHRIMHARLEIGDAVIMAGDAPPGMYQKPHSITVSITIEDNAEADRIFKELTDGGEVHMPIADTFWAERFGMGRDKFGVPWMINGKQKPM